MIILLCLVSLLPSIRNYLKNINRAYLVVVGFDESLNKIIKQMDINMRFWDIKNEEVITRYITSRFFGRRATDLFEAYKDGIGNLTDKLLQIFMDELNVNWAFIKEYKSEFSNKLLILEVEVYIVCIVRSNLVYMLLIGTLFHT